MIIRSRWRRAGGLAAHLGRTDTNEAVAVRTDLVRDMPADIGQAIALATAIARTNVRTVRDLIHITISPAAPLCETGLASVLALIEQEHAIPASMPRLVVEHRKGSRPSHFHAVFSVVDPETGRAVRSNNNFLHDEIASRRSEVALGEPIVPGAHHRAVIAALDQRGLDDEATIIATGRHVLPGDRLGTDTRRHAEASGTDAPSMADEAFRIWLESGGDRAAFEDGCSNQGFAIVRGETALLLLHNASGAHVPLARSLRQAAKKGGQAPEIRERDLREAFASAPMLTEARERGLNDEEVKAKAAVAAELERLEREAVRDNQQLLGERLRLVRERYARERKTEIRRTLAARRREIREAYARRDRIRRARINRAFVVARLLDRRDLREMVFGLAGGGILLAGGGLGLALCAAGVAVASLPTRERARAIAIEARLQRSDDADATAVASRCAYDEISAAHPERARFDFASVSKPHRIAAGAFCHLVLDGAQRALTESEIAQSAALRDLLGAHADKLEDAVRHGSGRGILAVLGWYDPNRQGHQRALGLALRSADPTQRQRPRPRSTKEHRGRSR